MINQQIQNYKIISLLGEGGMGDVYLGEHISIKRKVAIKVLKPELVKNEEIRKRFKNEASMLAHLQHPNIVGLVDYVEQEDGLFLIMEYVDGQGLDELIKAQHLPINIERAKKLMTQILQAFLYAHKNGIIHRDVKPSNILVTSDDQIKVLDFGIAKLVGDDQHHLTKTGTQIGTVYYMSPEQVKGKELDHRSDIYSLGVTFYELLSGVCPYRGMTTEYEIYDNIVKVPLLPLSQTMGSVYEKVWGVIEKATQKDAENRYENCGEYLYELENENLVKPKTVEKAKPVMEKVVASKVTTTEKPRNTKKVIISIAIVALVSLVGYFVWNKFLSKEENWKIENGVANNGENLSINYSFYSKDDGVLDTYQDSVNNLIRNFALASFCGSENLPKNGLLTSSFFDDLVKGCTSSNEKSNCTIKIDTSFINFDQVLMNCNKTSGGKQEIKVVNNRLVDKQTGQSLFLSDFVSNLDQLNIIGEYHFKNQVGMRPSEAFEGSEYTFNENGFYCPRDFYLANGNIYFTYQTLEIGMVELGCVTFAVPISELSHLLIRDISSKKPINTVELDVKELKDVEPLTNDEVLIKMSNYYYDIMNDNFNANNYYALKVKQFITRKDVTSDEINEIFQSSTENSEWNVNLNTETLNLDRIEGDTQYWNYWINFSCYRSSKGQYQKCNVLIEIGIDADNKLVSYKELKVTDLEYSDYNPAGEGY